jgi:hypothetical protein
MVEIRPNSIVLYPRCPTRCPDGGAPCQRTSGCTSVRRSVTTPLCRRPSFTSPRRCAALLFFLVDAGAGARAAAVVELLTTSSPSPALAPAHPALLADQAATRGGGGPVGWAPTRCATPREAGTTPRLRRSSGKGRLSPLAGGARPTPPHTGGPAHQQMSRTGEENRWGRRAKGGAGEVS